MNLTSRITKLEKLAAALPRFNREHLEAVVRFFETGDPLALPASVARSETLAVSRAIPIEDADAYPGLVLIAEGLVSGRLAAELRIGTATAAAALNVLQKLDVAEGPSPVVFGPPDAAIGPGEEPDDDPASPGEKLLSRLGIVQFYRVVYTKVNTLGRIPEK